MTPNFNLTENKIKTYLDEFNQDREKLFSELKMSNEVDKVSEKKIFLTPQDNQHFQKKVNYNKEFSGLQTLSKTFL
jgi:hypothetical protein